MRGVEVGVPWSEREAVARRRRSWPAVAISRAPIMETFLARQRPVLARNPDGFALLTIVHGLHPRRDLNPRTLSAVVENLNASRTSFVGRGRTRHGGLEKFEPRKMEALPLRILA